MLISNVYTTPDGYFCGEAFSTLFNKNIEIMFYDENDLNFAELCIQDFNTLDEHLIDNLCEYSINYCKSLCYSVGSQAPIFHNSRDVLTYIEPSVLEVDGTDETMLSYRIELNVQWEPEHGMEWVIRNGEILHVGPFEGIDIWDEKKCYKEIAPNFVHFQDFNVKTNLSAKITITTVALFFLAISVINIYYGIIEQNFMLLMLSIFMLIATIYYFLRFLVVKLCFKDNIINYIAWYGKKYIYSLNEISKVKIKTKGVYSWIKVFNHQNKVICRLESNMDNLDRLLAVLEQANVEFI